MNAATVTLTGLTLAATVNRNWFVLPALAAGFLMQHAITGWAPPVVLLESLGLRPEREIERDALRSRLNQLMITKDEWVETAGGRIKRASEA
jgi:hypothetical protein